MGGGSIAKSCKKSRAPICSDDIFDNLVASSRYLEAADLLVANLSNRRDEVTVGQTNGGQVSQCRASCLLIRSAKQDSNLPARPRIQFPQRHRTFIPL